MNIQYTKATINDLDGILEIEKKLNHRNLSDDCIKNDLSSESCYYISAKLDNKIIGYIGLELLVDHADITIVAVDINYRKKQIATNLIQEALRICSSLKLDNIFLEVRSSNIGAISLYEKVGFQRISKREKYYIDNLEDALIYKKSIT